MDTVYGPFKAGSHADANTGEVSLSVRAGSVTVKTNILIKNNSHQLVNWELSNLDRGYTSLMCIRGVSSTEGQDSISRTVKAFKNLKDNHVFPMAPNSSTAFSSITHHILTGYLTVYTGEVQETHSNTHPRIGTGVYF